MERGYMYTTTLIVVKNDKRRCWDGSVLLYFLAVIPTFLFTIICMQASGANVMPNLGRLNHLFWVGNIIFQYKH